MINLNIYRQTLNSKKDSGPCVPSYTKLIFQLSIFSHKQTLFSHFMITIKISTKNLMDISHMSAKAKYGEHLLYHLPTVSKSSKTQDHI